MSNSYLGQWARVAGIGGVAFGAVTLIFRDVIQKEVFSSLPPDLTFKLLVLIVVLSFVLGAIGVVGWIWLQKPGKSGKAWSYPCPYLGGHWVRTAQDGFGGQPLIIEQKDLSFTGSMDTAAGYVHAIKGTWNKQTKEYVVETTRTTSNPLPRLAEKGDAHGCQVILYGRYVPQGDGRLTAYVDRTDGKCGLRPDYQEKGQFVRLNAMETS